MNTPFNPQDARVRFGSEIEYRYDGESIFTKAMNLIVPAVVIVVVLGGFIGLISVCI